MFNPDIRVYDDPDALFEHLAAEVARQVTRASGRFGLALTGGRAAAGLYGQLGLAHSQVPWSTVDFFWSDERLVPREDPASNVGSAQLAWLSRLGVPEARLHRPDVSVADAEAVALAYEEDVRAYLGQRLRLDCVLLSLGEDGHIASLFPGHAATRETIRLVVAVTDSPKPPARRVTMTLPLINRARSVHLMAVGAKKASALRATLEDPGDVARCPARAIKPEAGVTVWVDRPALAEVPAARRRG